MGYKLPPAEKRDQMAGLPIDLAAKDTYLAFIQKATEWKRGGGINLTLILYNDDGTKVPHINGAEEVEIMCPLGLDNRNFGSWTKAIFPECDALKQEIDFELDDMQDRFVVVKLEQQKKQTEEDKQRYGPRINVAVMTAVPEMQRESVRQLVVSLTGAEPKNLASRYAAALQEANTAAAAPRPAVQQQKPATAPAPAAQRPAPQTAPAAGVPAGVDPNNPFGVTSLT